MMMNIIIKQEQEQEKTKAKIKLIKQTRIICNLNVPFIHFE